MTNSKLISMNNIEISASFYNLTIQNLKSQQVYNLDN